MPPELEPEPDPAPELELELPDELPDDPPPELEPVDPELEPDPDPELEPELDPELPLPANIWSCASEPLNSSASPPDAGSVSALCQKIHCVHALGMVGQLTP